MSSPVAPAEGRGRGRREVAPSSSTSQSTPQKESNTRSLRRRTDDNEPSPEIQATPGDETPISSDDTTLVDSSPAVGTKFIRSPSPKKSKVANESPLEEQNVAANTQDLSLSDDTAIEITSSSPPASPKESTMENIDPSNEMLPPPKMKTLATSAANTKSAMKERPFARFAAPTASTKEIHTDARLDLLKTLAGGTDPVFGKSHAAVDAPTAAEPPAKRQRKPTSKAASNESVSPPQERKKVSQAARDEEKQAPLSPPDAKKKLSTSLSSKDPLALTEFEKARTRDFVPPSKYVPPELAKKMQQNGDEDLAPLAQLRGKSVAKPIIEYEPLRLYQDSNWVLFDPLKGFPKEFGEPPAAMHRFATYNTGNFRILEYHLKTHSVRLKRTPEMLAQSYVRYTANGPRLSDSPPKKKENGEAVMAAPKEKLEEEEFTTDTGPAKRGSGRPTRQSRRTGRYAVARPGMKGPLGRKSEAVVVVEDADEDFEEEAAATVGDIGERPSFPGLV